MNVRNSSKVVSDTAGFLWVPDIACRNINICTQESYNQTATENQEHVPMQQKQYLIYTVYKFPHTVLFGRK